MCVCFWGIKYVCFGLVSVFAVGKETLIKSLTDDMLTNQRFDHQ